MEFEQKEQVQVGDWTFSLGIEGVNSVPEITAVNARTGESLRFKPREKAIFTKEDALHRPPPMLLRDGTKLTLDTVFDVLAQRFKAQGETVAPTPAKPSSSTEEQVPSDVEACMKVIEFYFSQILKAWTLRMALLKLPLALLEQILMSDRLLLGNEWQIFLLVKDWARLQLGEDIETEYREKEKREAKGKEKVEKKEKEEKPEGDKVEEKDKEKEEKKEGEQGKDKDKEGDEGDKEKDEEEESARQLPDFEEDIKLFEEGTTKEYKQKLGATMEPLVKYVRFPHMFLKVLKAIEDEDFIPRMYLTEAYRYHLFNGQDFFSVNVNDKRIRTRRYLFFKWDKTRKASGLILSEDGYSVSASSGCARQTIMGTHGFSSGMNSWEIKLNAAAGCYAAVGVCTKEFKVDSDTLGIAQDSWGFRLYSGSHCTTNDRRREASSLGQMKVGDTVRVELDMNAGRMAVYVNSKHQTTFKGLRKAGVLYPALSVCHNSPQESYTLLKRSIIWDWDGSKTDPAEDEKQKKMKEKAN